MIGAVGLRDWLGVRERRWKKAPDEEVQPGKTLWDWLQLLIVPAILVAVTFAWSDQQAKRDNKREDRRLAADAAAAKEVRRDTTLNDYFKQMSDLMLNKNLRSAKPLDPVESVARTVTLTTLRRLDGKRQGEVVQFLQEARLISAFDGAVINLRGVDLGSAKLRGADLSHADLILVDFSGADLENADFSGAVLREAKLRGADLSGADLTEAVLFGAAFRGANLAGADLRDARLNNAAFRGADLTYADLRGADLEDADLRGADLRDADLRGADLRGANLRGAFTLLGGASFAGAKLSGANLVDAEFSNPTLDLIGDDYEYARGLDLGHFITDLPPGRRKVFLASQKEFLDSLTPRGLAEFNLSPEKLAKFRREARGD
jgi:uncharacterized protein YjbI with pentapeptide repeats